MFTERELIDNHAYLKEEAGRPCLPEGILRFTVPAASQDDAFVLPEASWLCREFDLPIDEWIRLGRCRYSWRLPLAPPGPSPWRPPLSYQWTEPTSLWQDRVQLKGSPIVRRFSGTADEFHSFWDEALKKRKKLTGRWLISRNDARWRGGLREDAGHEVRYVLRAQRVVLLLSPEPRAALTFTEIRHMLAGWTEPDDVPCVPICGAASDFLSSALHTIVTPSTDFPEIQDALNAVPEDELLHRVVIRSGTYDLTETLIINRPLLLEGEGRWATVLRTKNKSVMKIVGPGASSAMVRNLHFHVQSPSSGEGAAAVELCLQESKEEPAISGCIFKAEGRWGQCLHIVGGSPQLVRNRFSVSRWGVVIVHSGGRFEDNEVRGIGEHALILIGGSTWVHRNRISDCGGAGALIGSDCRAVFEANDVRDCLSGVRIIGKRSEVQMRAGNRLLHNGLCDDHQLEAPPGVIPSGATAMVRSCRPYSFLPKSESDLLDRMRQSREPAELVILIRAARRRGFWAEAFKAHRLLAELRPVSAKATTSSSSPSPREVVVATKSWDGISTGYGDSCVSLEAGTLCEVLRRDESGWVLIDTSKGVRGWCSPHVFS